MKNLIINKLLILLSTLSAFFLPITPVMIAVGVLIFIDLIFGIIAAKKIGEIINSKRMSKSIIKMLLYQLLIITAHIINIYLITFLPILKITLVFLASIEFISISENFTKITKQNFIKYIKSYLFKKLKGEDYPKIT